MALYASFQARGTRGAELATLGAISAPLPSLANDQLFIARAAAGCSRPAKGQAHAPPPACGEAFVSRRTGRSGPCSVRTQPIAVQSSTSVPSGQRT